MGIYGRNQTWIHLFWNRITRGVIATQRWEGADVPWGPRIELHSGKTKEERRATPENKVNYSALAPGWCDCLQYSSESVLWEWKTNSARGRWKWQQMAHFLCFVIQREAGVWFTRVLCSARNTVISCHLSQQRQECVFQTGGQLSSPHPSLWYYTSLRSVMHHRGVPAGMSPLLLSANVPQHLGCRPLIGKDQKESLRARRTRKRSVRKGKRLVRWGEKMSWVFMFTACPFDVHTKTTWGPQQPVPVANTTVHLAATLHAWDCAPPLFPPRPMLRSAAVPSLSLLPTSQPSISHAKAHLAPPDQTLHSCQPVSWQCQ